jgi:hypothetical protein
VTSGTQEVSTHIQAITVGIMATRLLIRTQASLATPPNPGHKTEATQAENRGGSQANKESCVGAATLNNNSTFGVCRTPPLLAQHETAILDSGCTGHFLLVTAPCLNKVASHTPLTVRLPNGAIMESSHTADLEIPGLNASASKAHVFPGMANHSLLSVGKLCDEGYIFTFQ